MTTSFYLIVAKSMDRGENLVVLAAMDFIEAVLQLTVLESQDYLMGRWNGRTDCASASETPSVC
jgi:hypothetical protein